MLLLTVWEVLCTAEYSQITSVHSHMIEAVLLFTVWKEFVLNVISKNTSSFRTGNGHPLSVKVPIIPLYIMF